MLNCLLIRHLNDAVTSVYSGANIGTAAIRDPAGFMLSQHVVVSD